MAQIHLVKINKNVYNIQQNPPKTQRKMNIYKTNISTY